MIERQGLPVHSTNALTIALSISRNTPPFSDGSQQFVGQRRATGAFRRIGGTWKTIEHPPSFDTFPTVGRTDPGSTIYQTAHSSTPFSLHSRPAGGRPESGHVALRVRPRHRPEMPRWSTPFLARGDREIDTRVVQHPFGII